MLLACGGGIADRKCEGMPERTALLHEKYGVRCCSDSARTVTMGPATEKAPTWPKGEGCSVWAESDDGLGPGGVAQCRKSSTYAEAEAACHAAGARLCTAPEIRAGCTQSTGCALDGALVWTSNLTSSTPDSVQLDGKSLRPILEGGPVDSAGEPAPWLWRMYILLEVFYTRAVVSWDGWKYLAKRFPPEIQAIADQGIPVDHQGLPPGHRQYLRLFKGELPEHYPFYLDDDQLYKIYDDQNTYLNETINLYDSTDPAAVGALALLEEAMRDASAALPHTFGEFAS